MVVNHEAIYALYPNVIGIAGDVAHDKDYNVVEYDRAAVDAKGIELEAAKEAAKQAAIAAKESAVAKLATLGLTEAEVKALLG